MVYQKANVLLDVSPNEAKQLVHFSKAWSHQIKQDEDIQEITFLLAKSEN